MRFSWPKRPVESVESWDVLVPAGPSCEAASRALSYSEARVLGDNAAAATNEVRSAGRSEGKRWALEMGMGGAALVMG